MARSLARLALEAAAEPPAGGDAHADSPIEPPKHTKCPRNTQMARGGGVACAGPMGASTWGRRSGGVGQRAGVEECRHGALSPCVVGGRPAFCESNQQSPARDALHT